MRRARRSAEWRRKKISAAPWHSSQATFRGMSPAKCWPWTAVGEFGEEHMTASMELAKFNPFTNDVIFIDGLWGSGKSVLAPIMSGMRGVEKQKLDPAF